MNDDAPENAPENAVKESPGETGGDPKNAPKSALEKSAAARRAILNRLRQNLREPTSDADDLSDSPSDLSDPPSDRLSNRPSLAPYLDERKPQIDRDDIETFITTMTGAGAQIIRTTPAERPQRLIEILARHQARNLLHNPRSLGDDLAARLQESGIEPIPVAEEPQSWRRDAFAADAALTDCLAAIVASGSLVMAASPPWPRLMSLAPPLHIVDVRIDQLSPTLAHLFAEPHVFAERGRLRLRRDDDEPIDEKRFDPPSNLFIVSGPSRTADIEQNLVQGAHGPKHLVILLIDETGRTL